MTENASTRAELRSPETLVAGLGPHASTAAGIDLDGGDADLGRWLTLCILLGGRTQEKDAHAAYQRLEKEGAAAPAALARAGMASVHAWLEDAGLRKSEPTAAVLVRVASNLVANHDGSLERLASRADSLEELAHTLSGLGAGFGRSAIARLLTPLRTRFSAANDLPATPAVLAAGIHLGILGAGHDEEGAPAALSHWLGRNESNDTDVAPRDLEAALERLGRAACLRERADRCPLEAACPQRER